MGNNYWDERWWQLKNWRYGKLLLVWQESTMDNGLWQLFLPKCRLKNLPREQQFNPLTCSDKLHQKETALDELLNRDNILKVAKKDIFCGWNRFSTFESDVLAHLAKIPAGKVISYGALANWSGYPRAARAVGRLMAKNPFPLFYP